MKYIKGYLVVATLVVGFIMVMALSEELAKDRALQKNVLIAGGLLLSAVLNLIYLLTTQAKGTTPLPLRIIILWMRAKESELEKKAGKGGAEQGTL